MAPAAPPHRTVVNTVRTAINAWERDGGEREGGAARWIQARGLLCVLPYVLPMHSFASLAALPSNLVLPILTCK